MKLLKILILLSLIAIAFGCGAENGDTPLKEKETELSYTASELWIQQVSEYPRTLDHYIIPGVRTSVSADMIISRAPSGATAESIFERWYSRFVPPKGNYIEDVSVQKDTTVNQIHIESTYLFGSYKDTKVPAVFGNKIKLTEDYALFGALIEADGKKWTVKVVGPKNTIVYWKGNFREFLKSMKVK